MAEELEIEVRLRYFEISEDLCLATAFQPAEVKDRIGAKAMARLGITVPEGVRPIDAWLSAMAAENELADSRPAHPALLNAVQIDRAAWRFYYALI